MALIRTDLRFRRQPAGAPGTAPTGFGYGPASLQNAYKLPSSSAGSGQTVAVVDAYDDPTAAADLAAYRSAWGLPACGSGCFTKVNQNGQASPLPATDPTGGWEAEESLDLDMVSAICPKCHILLVEANGYSTNAEGFTNLGTGVDTAVAMGAKFVSNSYGGPETSSDPAYDSQYFNHPGVAVTAAAGDYGYGVSYPAASLFVTSVGGTRLTPASNARGWTETTWSPDPGATGSGCSGYDPKPIWQTDTGCTRRTDNDVAAVADPLTGVAVYDSTPGPCPTVGWCEAGGTSAASPIIASVYALAGTPLAATYPSAYIYDSSHQLLFDVTSGSNGSCSPTYLCTAGPGYDGPTGWGTPDGAGAFTFPDVVTVTNPGPQTTALGSPVALQIKAASNHGYSLTCTATGLPPGLAINSTCLISGKPSSTGTYTVKVTASENLLKGAHSGSATFTWSVFRPIHPAGNPAPRR
jgi:subtilase family serine protease